MTESEDDEPEVTITPKSTPTPTPTPSATPRRPSSSGTTGSNSGTTTAPTPSLVGLTVEEARKLLLARGLRRDGLDGLRGSARIVGQRESAGGLLLVTVAEEEPEAGEDPGIAPDNPVPTETEPLDPSNVPADATQSVDDLVAECSRLDENFDRAQLRLDDDLDMQLDEPTRLPVEVTLDIDAPSRRVVTVDETTVDIRVTCRVKAQLRGAPEEFDIDERDWVTQSLLTERTAQWSWFVTPRRAGDTQLELALQPVVHVDTEDSDAITGEIAASVLRHPIAVSVSAPADQSIGAWLERATGLLNSAQGLLVALTALIVAALGLWAVTRQRRKPTPQA